jgi:hypothetical protein
MVLPAVPALIAGRVALSLAEGLGPCMILAGSAAGPATSGSPHDQTKQPGNTVNRAHIPRNINLHQLVVQQN